MNVQMKYSSSEGIGFKALQITAQAVIDGCDSLECWITDPNFDGVLNLKSDPDFGHIILKRGVTGSIQIRNNILKDAFKWLLENKHQGDIFGFYLYKGKKVLLRHEPSYFEIELTKEGLEKIKPEFKKQKIADGILTDANGKKLRTGIKSILKH